MSPARRRNIRLQTTVIPEESRLVLRAAFEADQTDAAWIRESITIMAKAVLAKETDDE